MFHVDVQCTGRHVGIFFQWREIFCRHIHGSEHHESVSGKRANVRVHIFFRRRLKNNVCRSDRAQAITLGADKAYDAEDFVNELRSMRVTPHVAQNTSGRRSAIDGRTTRHGGYALSQRIRKRIEEAFGWIKTVAGQQDQVPWN